MKLRCSKNDIIITHLQMSSSQIKTTSPEKFRVRPSSGTLALGASVTIHVLLQPGYQLPPLTRDKFLIMHLPVQSAGMSAAEIADLWKVPVD